MKLNGRMLVSVAMMVGAVGAVGCKSATPSGSPEGAAQEQPVPAAVKVDAQAQAPTTTNDTTLLAKTTIAVQQQAPAPRYATHAPPAMRFENRGRAPSDRHFWITGEWSWNEREYVWVPGRWDVRREGYAYVGPRCEHQNGRWVYVPGYWSSERRFLERDHRVVVHQRDPLAGRRFHDGRFPRHDHTDAHRPAQPIHTMPRHVELPRNGNKSGLPGTHDHVRKDQPATVVVVHKR